MFPSPHGELGIARLLHGPRARRGAIRVGDRRRVERSRGEPYRASGSGSPSRSSTPGSTARARAAAARAPRAVARARPRSGPWQGAVCTSSSSRCRCGNLAASGGVRAREFAHLDRQLRGELGKEWYPSGLVAVASRARRRRTAHPARRHRVLPGDRVGDLARRTTSRRWATSSSRRATTRRRGARSTGRPRCSATTRPRRVGGAPVPPGCDRDARRARRDRRGRGLTAELGGVRPPPRPSVGARDRGTLGGASRTRPWSDGRGARVRRPRARGARAARLAVRATPRTLLVRGGTLRRLGRRRDAAAALAEARSRVRGASQPALAREGGGRGAAARRAPRSGRRADPTETRVAELAGQGLRNAEIAARLYVTPKTVEATLSRVYRKLGIRSRTELARRETTSSRRRARSPGRYRAGPGELLPALTAAASSRLRPRRSADLDGRDLRRRAAVRLQDDLELRRRRSCP